MTVTRLSRRGAASFPDIRLTISHPDYVDIPLPTDPPGETVSKKRRRPSTLLSDDVIPLLQKNGLVAETVSINPISWQGIVRLPESSESSAERIAAIKEISGQYRVMHITCVLSSPLLSSTSLTEAYLGSSLKNLEALVCYL
jgi:DNA polymerase beta